MSWIHQSSRARHILFQTRVAIPHPYCIGLSRFCQESCGQSEPDGGEYLCVQVFLITSVNIE
jgi:hypothetical protein